MSEHAVEVAQIDWKRTFVWVRLFRAFRTAIDLRMLFLGSVALVAITGADSLFVHLPFAPQRPSRVAFRIDQPGKIGRPLDLPAEFMRNPWGELWLAAADWGAPLRPARTIVDPTVIILRAEASWSEKTLAWTRLLWASCVWSVIAGAMTRIAAVEQAREGKLSLVTALKFSVTNFWSYMTAILLPAAGIGVFWILCLIGGWIGRLPFVGGPLLGLLWGVELVFGFMMALILIGAAAGWPLMFATISTEGSDGFDGFSRAYSYVFSRPWNYLWYGVVAIVYGAVLSTFVSVVAMLVTYLTGAAVASGLGLESTGGLMLGVPESLGGADVLTRTPAALVGIGTLFTGAWLHLVAILVAGFVASYFWSAITLIYLLLRHADDATAFHEVYLPEEKEVDDLLPLVGTAANRQPVIERPAEGDFADDRTRSAGRAAGSNVPPDPGSSIGHSPGVHAPGLQTPSIAPGDNGGPSDATEFNPQAP